MTNCLLPWLPSISERSRKVAAADRLLKRSFDIRHKVSAQRRNPWPVALWRAFVCPLKSNGGSWLKNLTDVLLQAFRAPVA
jgi:hypothetical protein